MGKDEGDGFPPVVHCSRCDKKKICHPCAECQKLLCWSCLESNKERSCMECGKYICSLCYGGRRKYGRCSECQEYFDDQKRSDWIDGIDDDPYWESGLE